MTMINKIFYNDKSGKINVDTTKNFYEVTLDNYNKMSPKTVNGIAKLWNRIYSKRSLSHFITSGLSEGMSWTDKKFLPDFNTVNSDVFTNYIKVNGSADGYIVSLCGLGCLYDDLGVYIADQLSIFHSSSIPFIKNINNIRLPVTYNNEGVEILLFYIEKLSFAFDEYGILRIVGKIKTIINESSTRPINPALIKCISPRINYILNHISNFSINYITNIESAVARDKENFGFKFKDINKQSLKYLNSNETLDLVYKEIGKSTNCKYGIVKTGKITKID